MFQLCLYTEAWQNPHPLSCLGTLCSWLICLLMLGTKESPALSWGGAREASFLPPHSVRNKPPGRPGTTAPRASRSK
jgi:hypothetical protein